jgi:hypothetical protein
MSGGVRRIHVSDCTFIGTDIGLRFKSTRGRGGLVEDIHIENIRMTDIDGAAISFNLFYEGVEGSGAPSEEAVPVSELTPVFRGIVMRDIVCTWAEEALIVNGLAEMPLENVRIERYEAAARRGALCHNAKGLTLERVLLRAQEGPLIKLHQCQDVELVALAGDLGGQEGAMLQVSGDRSARIACRGAQTAPGVRDVVVAHEVAARPTVE